MNQILIKNVPDDVRQRLEGMEPDLLQEVKRAGRSERPSWEGEQGNEDFKVVLKMNGRPVETLTLKEIQNATDDEILKSIGSNL